MLVISLFAIALWLPPPGAGSEGLSNPLPLMRTALVTDIDAPISDDDPGTGGGFETSTYFQAKLAAPSAIMICIDAIEHTATKWAGDVGLVRGFKERGETTLTLHYTKADLPGLFAMRYEVKALSSAFVRVDYYSLDGSKQAPETAAALLDRYHISSFQDDLDKALFCSGGAS
jgi:hypothetical protein